MFEYIYTFWLQVSCSKSRRISHLSMTSPMMASRHDSACSSESTLQQRTDSAGAQSRFVSVWVQAPISDTTDRSDLLNIDTFNNIARRIADRGSCIRFVHWNHELYFEMATEVQANRVFQRVNNAWILEQQVFIRCRYDPSVRPQTEFSRYIGRDI